MFPQADLRTVESLLRIEHFEEVVPVVDRDGNLGPFGIDRTILKKVQLRPDS